MLRDCISASVVLCDKSLRIISLATWPRNLEAIIKKGVEELEGLPPDQQSAEFALLPDSRMYRFSISLDPGQEQGRAVKVQSCSRRWKFIFWMQTAVPRAALSFCSCIKIQ